MLPQDSLKIGYPDEWRDYWSFEIGCDSYLSNVRTANAFETRKNLNKIGQPIDRNEWGDSSSDDQRLLQSPHERDRLPGCDHATTLL